MTNNKIELISTNILHQHQKLFKDLVDMNKDLALSAGWHYILDWTWAISQIKEIDGKTILDAGAGIGFLQWYLASKGAHIISVDRSDRTCIPFHLKDNFNVHGLTSADMPLNIFETLNIFNNKATIATRARAIVRGLLGSLKYRNNPSVTGSVEMYKKDLSSLTNISDNSIDLIVSISALEHNPSLDGIREIVSELYRVLKPGGKMVITLPASQDKDWFFEPAYSWCFTEAAIKDVFGLADSTPANYGQYQKILEEIKSSTELKMSLSRKYYFSKNSGLPQGIWDPKYIPVGVIKIKPEIVH